MSRKCNVILDPDKRTFTGNMIIPTPLENLGQFILQEEFAATHKGEEITWAFYLTRVEKENVG